MHKNIKDIIENAVGPKLGSHMHGAPYWLGLGPNYHKQKKRIQAGIDEQNYFENLFSLVHYAYHKIPFYNKFYKINNFHPQLLKEKSDWARVPIIKKQDLKAWQICDRSVGKKYLQINTGGTSGEPLEFRVPSNAFSYEWAHMHSIWKSRGYKFGDIKLTFRGKHFDNKILKYNVIHNEYVVNASAGMNEVVSEILNLNKTVNISWIHGYPSLIAEFAEALSRIDEKEIKNFTFNIKGILLGSEYPAKIYRDKINSYLSTNIVSWYGHSEMSILAVEREKGVYHSLPTYGYAESVANNDNNCHHLIATSLFNKIHPFIRYDTGDLIEPVSVCKGSLAFKVNSGRIGDFIIDKNGQRHSLTAIIFGRHHNSFSYIEHVQIRQKYPGSADIFVSGLDASIAIDDLKDLFDFNRLNVDFNFFVINEPIRSAAGKILLKLENDP